MTIWGSAGLCQGWEVGFTLDEFYLEVQANADVHYASIMLPMYALKSQKNQKRAATSATKVQDSSLEADAQSWAVSSP